LIAVVWGGETVMVLNRQTKQWERNEDALSSIVLPSVGDNPQEVSTQEATRLAHEFARAGLLTD
jgi:hypothetical protein